jgi:hypothetical protein
MNARSASKGATLAALFAAAAIDGPALAQNVVPLSYNFTANGPTVVLDKWTCWFGSGCKYAPCNMRIVQEPRLGRLRPKVSQGTIPQSGGVCAGTPIVVMSMWYTPRPGAHGFDQFVLDSRSENGSHHVISISVDVP